MKAYSLSIKNNDDAGQAIVFAKRGREAKRQVFAHDHLASELHMYGGWIDLRVNRSPKFDGMENLTESELALVQWKDGWQWFDTDCPDVEEATDEAFLWWYQVTFKPLLANHKEEHESNQEV